MKLHNLYSHLKHPFNQQNRLYASALDPWDMAREREQFRFEETNRIIQEHFPGVRSIIEFGSGEGHQTQWLSRIAPVSGVEVSSIAVRRARTRCPAATFAVGSVVNYTPGELFDLSTAFECLWYVPKEQYATEIKNLSSCAHNSMVSYYHKQKPHLDPLIFSMDGVGSETIETDGIVWTVAWWNNKRP